MTTIPSMPADGDTADLPLAPLNPLPYFQRLRAVRNYHSGPETLRDAGGPVTRWNIGPRWLTPTMVLATSPGAIRDVLTPRDGSVDKTTPVFNEVRRVLGANLANLPHEEWAPRRRTIQPVFTKQHVREFGDHMAGAAESVGALWADGAEIDLDAESRLLSLRALGRSVLGINLDERPDVVEALHIAIRYAMHRALIPLRAPRWLPTPMRRRAREASGHVHRFAHRILQACREDPTVEAPLVRALMDARDPETGRALSDDEIADELIIFIFAGHDTTATTLTYALWALGHHPDIQNRLAAEVSALPGRELTPDDVPRLGYTVQVIRESLRLCPPGPTGTRMATRDMQVGGYRIAAGTMLVVGRMAVQRDPALWADPMSFDPDRFSPERFKKLDRWQYIPFGGGTRSCIGDHFAMLENTLALATIVRRTEFTSLSTDFPLKLHFTMVPGGPVMARTRRRRPGGRVATA